MSLVSRLKLCQNTGCWETPRGLANQKWITLRRCSFNYPNSMYENKVLKSTSTYQSLKSDYSLLKSNKRRRLQSLTDKWHNLTKLKMLEIYKIIHSYLMLFVILQRLIKDWMTIFMHSCGMNATGQGGKSEKCASTC